MQEEEEVVKLYHVVILLSAVAGFCIAEHFCPHPVPIFHTGTDEIAVYNHYYGVE
jgi:hypothetical protein